MTPATADRRADDGPDETAALLGDLATLLETIDWRAVPTVSTYEAAAITARVEEARTAVEEAEDP